MTHKNSYFCISIPSQVRSLSIEMQEHLLAIQVCVNHHSSNTNRIKSQHMYELDSSDDLPDGLIPLAVNHKVNHTYSKLLKIPVLNTSYKRVYIPRSTTYLVH